jgi:predicted DsbA family dithiol-disulfide isomerase
VAPITIALFGHLACASCSALASKMKRLDERFPGRIRFVWKHLPSWPSGQVAAEIAAAAHAQAGFWALHEQAWRTPAQRLGRAELLAAATAAGLDAARIERELIAGTHRPSVQADVDEARRMGVTGAPAMVMNGVVVLGEQPLELYERMVQRELESGLLDRLRR